MDSNTPKLEPNLSAPSRVAASVDFMDLDAHDVKRLLESLDYLAKFGEAKALFDGRLVVRIVPRKTEASDAV